MRGSSGDQLSEAPESIEDGDGCHPDGLGFHRGQIDRGVLVPRYTGGSAGSLGDDTKRPARHEAAGAEPGQELRVGIRETNDLVSSRPRPGEPGGVEWAAGASLRGGDRVPVRIGRRLSQLGVDALDHRVGDGVLETFGLVVDLLPRIPQGGDEEGLQQSVPAHHRDRVRAPLRGEGDGFVGLVLDEPLGGQSLDGVGDVGGGGPHPRRQGCGGDRRVAP
ncbi:hypothetical protein PCS70012_02324, partial [Streptococcus pneumoniae PCS70012]